jgi:hypothetical protein
MAPRALGKIHPAYRTPAVAILGNMFIKQRMEALIGLGFIGLGAIVYCIVFSSGERRGSSPP